jgi:hypothetical protein
MRTASGSPVDALRSALASGFPELRKAAESTIRKAVHSTETDVKAAEKLGLSKAAFYLLKKRFGVDFPGAFFREAKQARDPMWHRDLRKEERSQKNRRGECRGKTGARLVPGRQT